MVQYECLSKGSQCCNEPTQGTVESDPRTVLSVGARPMTSASTARKKQEQLKGNVRRKLRPSAQCGRKPNASKQLQVTLVVLS
jgi:hypothetical protein